MGQKGIIASHDKCDIHKQAMIDWKQYKINMQYHMSVRDRNNFISQQQIHYNRHYIKTIAEVLHYKYYKIWPYEDIGKERILTTLETY